MYLTLLDVMQEGNLQNDIEKYDIVEIPIGNAILLFNSHNRFDFVKMINQIIVEEITTISNKR